jgi:hypothetical protein
MPIESLPLRPGSLLQADLALVYLLEINDFKDVRDTVALDLDLFASIPARVSAASLPGAPE